MTRIFFNWQKLGLIRSQYAGLRKAFISSNWVQFLTFVIQPIDLKSHYKSNWRTSAECILWKVHTMFRASVLFLLVAVASAGWVGKVIFKQGIFYRTFFPFRAERAFRCRTATALVRRSFGPVHLDLITQSDLINHQDRTKDDRRMAITSRRTTSQSIMSSIIRHRLWKPNMTFCHHQSLSRHSLCQFPHNFTTKFMSSLDIEP